MAAPQFPAPRLDRRGRFRGSGRKRPWLSGQSNRLRTCRSGVRIPQGAPPAPRRAPASDPAATLRPGPSQPGRHGQAVAGASSSPGRPLSGQTRSPLVLGGIGGGWMTPAGNRSSGPARKAPLPSAAEAPLAPEKRQDGAPADRAADQRERIVAVFRTLGLEDAIDRERFRRLAKTGGSPVGGTPGPERTDTRNHTVAAAP